MVGIWASFCDICRVVARFYQHRAKTHGLQAMPQRLLQPILLDQREDPCVVTTRSYRRFKVFFGHLFNVLTHPLECAWFLVALKQPMAMISSAIVRDVALIGDGGTCCRLTQSRITVTSSGGTI